MERSWSPVAFGGRAPGHLTIPRPGRRATMSGGFLAKLRGTSREGVLRAISGTKEPLYEVAAVVEAPVEKVTEHLFAKNPFVPESVFQPGDPAITRLPDGEEYIKVGHGSLHQNRARRMVGYQGGWWYRGEFSVEPHPKGSLYVYRVYNVAKKWRYMVPLVQFGMAAQVEQGAAAGIAGLGDELGCP